MKDGKAEGFGGKVQEVACSPCVAETMSVLGRIFNF